ncbi:MAG: cation diffusion facilitator family transporter [Chloroflexi bacterium]|nr:cation diffusion facilitator family transporter [Chloroflexota bacterium]
MTQTPSAAAQHRRALLVTFALNLAYLVIEAAGGIATNSLALLADAAHMLTDVGGLALALFAMWMAQRPATPQKTFGYYRVEILAALVNAVVLFVMAFFILYEAWGRFSSPPEVASLPMFATAGVGLVVNLIGIRNLRRGSTESLNVQGAFLEVVSDTLGSLGVILTAVIMLATPWYYADPLFSVLIGLFILPRTWGLMMQAVNVLLEGTPAHVGLKAVEEAMRSVPGVAAVHDLHVWTITSGMEALSAHVLLVAGTDPRDAQRILELLNARLKEGFGIAHATIQLESANLADLEGQP